MYGYCQEKIDIGHYWDLKGYIIHLNMCDNFSKK